MITWDDVVAIAPELAATGEAARIAILIDVPLQLDASQWGKRYDLAAKYLAAHLATISGRRGQAGAVTSETAGPLSRSYAAPMFSDEDGLTTTSYGREFLRLRRMSLGGAIAVT